MTWIGIIIFILICIAINKANSSSKKESVGPIPTVSYRSNTSQADERETAKSAYRTEASDRGFLRLDGKEDSKRSRVYTDASMNGAVKKVQSIEQLIKLAKEKGEEYITEVEFEVKGLYYQGERALIEAECLVKGDILNLEPESDNPKDRNAIKVYTERDIPIGYVPKGCAQELNSRKLDFIDCFVRYVKKGYDTAYVKATARYYGDFFINDDGNDVECLVHKLHNYIEPAMKLKKAEKYDKAASAFINAGQKEPSLNDKLAAYTQACICLRKIKDYESEIEIINLILSTLSNLLQDSYKLEEYQNRLESAIKLKDNLAKKKMIMKNSKKGRLIANLVDSLYINKLNK